MSEQSHSPREADLYGGGAPSEQPKPPGLAEQFMGVFTEPVALFGKLRAAPSWVPALLVVGLLALTMMIAWSLRVDVDAMIRPALESNPKVPAEQVDRIIAMQAKIIPVFAPISTLVGICIAAFLPALVFFLLGRGGGEQGAPSYPQALSAATVPNLLLVPQQIVVTVLCLATPVGGATPDKLSPTSVGYFLEVESPKLGALLRHIDPFFIGVYVVTWLALRHLLRLKPAHAWVGTLLCAATTLGFRVLGAR